MRAWSSSTAPCTNEGEQPDGAPWPEDNPARLAVYNRLVREVAAAHPKTDSVVDLYGAVCPHHQFTSTIHGVVVRRTDGVHFTDGCGRGAGGSADAADRGRGPDADGRDDVDDASTVVPSGIRDRDRVTAG